MVEDELTQDKVKELFYYEEGCIYHKTDKGNFRCKDRQVGVANSSKRLTTFMQGKSYLVHRLIFLYHKGYSPKCIDHIDGNYLNNRIENLRESTIAENQWNCKIRKDNSSGFKNVYYVKKSGNWRVLLQLNNKSKSFGTFKDLELAAFVAEQAREKYHGEFAYV